MLAPNDGPRASALLLPSAVAVCPVLALYAANCDQVAIDEAWRAMLFAGLIGLATGAYCRVAFGRGDKAAVVSCGLVAVFGSHGHIARIATWQAHDLGLVIVVVETLTLVMLVVGVARATRDLNAVTRGITMVTGALFASSLLVLLFGGIRRAGAGPVPDDSMARRATGVRHPDIYYIVLDGYGRADMLREYMAFDNQPFVDQLEHRGFTVLKESRPNYGQTLLSLASSLNFEFLDVARLSPGGATDLGVAVSMIKHNRVMRAFKAHGYVVATAPSGFQGTDPMPEADVAWGGRFSTLNEFERMSLGLTAGSALLAFTLGQETDTYEAHRATILSAFEHLRSSGARTDGTPRFAFVHIVAPHPPFVFDEAGALPPQDRPFARSDGPYFLGRRAEYQQRYAAQARFLNDSVIEAVDEIFAATGPDDHPIIILQGDHGPASHFDPYSGPDYLRERMAILNAWYVPPDLEVDLYDAITPVNTFRVVLNAVFDEQLPLMPDRSLFSTYYDPFEFTEVGEDGRPVR